MAEFKKVVTKNEELNRVQDAMKAAYDPLLRGVFSSSSLLSFEFKAATTTYAVAHALGREPVGFIVVDKEKAMDVWRVAWSAQGISLQASQAGKVKILLF